MFELLVKELKIIILKDYLSIKDASIIRLSNKNILNETNYLFEETINNNRGKYTCNKISNIFNKSYFTGRTNVQIIWEIPLKSIRIIKKKSYLILHKGDFISFWGYEEGVKITNFTGHEDSPGPIGFDYLPWWGDQWAEPLFGLRGNPRHIIAYPTGITHYGQHIHWYSVRLLNNGKCPE
jgi:hypothetical protein